MSGSGTPAEFVRYCAVGGLGVIVNLGVLVALREAGMRLEVASPLAIECSIVFNFVLHVLWTFRRRAVERGAVLRFLRFHVVAGVAGLVNYATLLLLTGVMGLWYVAANLGGIGIGTAVNYALNSAWTWKRNTQPVSHGPREGARLDTPVA